MHILTAAGSSHGYLHSNTLYTDHTPLYFYGVWVMGVLVGICGYWGSLELYSPIYIGEYNSKDPQIFAIPATPASYEKKGCTEVYITYPYVPFYFDGVRVLRVYRNISSYIPLYASLFCET